MEPLEDGFDPVRTPLRGDVVCDEGCLAIIEFSSDDVGTARHCGLYVSWMNDFGTTLDFTPRRRHGRRIAYLRFTRRVGARRAGARDLARRSLGAGGLMTGSLRETQNASYCR